MKVRYYFYSGNTPIVNGANAQFSGTYRRQMHETLSDVLTEIKDHYRKEFGCEVHLAAFSLVEEVDEY